MLMEPTMLQAVIETNIYEPNIRRIFCPYCDEYLGEYDVTVNNTDYKMVTNCTYCGGKVVVK